MCLLMGSEALKGSGHTAEHMVEPRLGLKEMLVTDQIPSCQAPGMWASHCGPSAG